MPTTKEKEKETTEDNFLMLLHNTLNRISNRAWLHILSCGKEIELQPIP